MSAPNPLLKGTVDTKTATDVAPMLASLSSHNPSESVIKQILKLAEDFKKTKEYEDKDRGKRTVLELYGFALGLCQQLQEEELKKIVEQHFKSIIKEFVLEDTRQIMDVPLKNLAENLSRLKGKLN